MGHIIRNIVLGAAVWSWVVSESHAIYGESPADEPPRYCTVFTHFVKSGGSSVKRQLTHGCWGDGSRAPGLIPGDAKTPPLKRLAAVANSTIIVGSAELLRNQLANSGRDCEYFTMLRNPIERLVSAFYYCPTDHDIQNRPAKWCGGSEDDKRSLEERLVDFSINKWGNKAFDFMIPAVICDPAFQICYPGDEQSARINPRNINSQEGWRVHGEVKRVLSTYVAVGIFEEWELSMRLFNAKVTTPVHDWDADVAINPGTRSDARKGLLAWAHTNPELHNLLAADILLYDYALALFRQQTADTLGVEWA